MTDDAYYNKPTCYTINVENMKVAKTDKGLCNAKLLCPFHMYVEV